MRKKCRIIFYYINNGERWRYVEPSVMKKEPPARVGSLVK